PARSPSSVVLPEPDSPTIARLSPRANDRLTPSRMTRRPSGPSTTLPTLSAPTAVPISSLMLKTILCALLFTFVAGARAAPAKATAPILVLGDSLSSAHRIAPEAGWEHLLEQRLQPAGDKRPIVNASISGETTSGGLARLPKLLADAKPAL